MADTYVEYTADGNTQTFTVPFPYIDASHVLVYLNGVQQLTPKDYVWANAGSITFFGKPLQGVVVKFQRSTSPDSALVTYQNGAVLSAAALNTATLQNFYRTQEIADALDTYITGGVTAYNVQGSVVGLSAQELIDQVASEVLQSNLAAQLQNNLTNIDNNAQSILQNTQDINTLNTYQGIGVMQIISLLGAVNSNSSAFILNTSTTKVSDTTSLADQFTQLQTSINGNTSSIATQATTINGLSAQYTVKVDVNGHVAGYGLASEAVDGTVTSTFIVNANAFAIIDTANGLSGAQAPFVVTGGVVYMRNVVIQDAVIDSLQITKLTQGSLNADMNVGTGKIVWTNGAYMKVVGVGFGSSNQFLEWFGPTQAAPYTGCTETNATAYLKTDGTAYFGGSLLAGKLVNSQQSTVLDSTNVCNIGPFSSNGGTITVTFSWTFDGFTSYTGDTTGLNNYNATPKQDPSGTAVLSLSLAGGAFVDVATLNISGTYNAIAPIPADSSPGSYQQTMSGSSTYTDSNHNTDTRQYKLRITAWNNINTNVQQNTLSIQSVE